LQLDHFAATTDPTSPVSVGVSEALEAIQNLDQASKVEIQRVIQKETRKAEIQNSLPPSIGVT
jgi:hypothetical protein